MRAYLQQFLYQIRGSYWFVPSLMVVGAIILSQSMIFIDHRIGNDWLRQVWFASVNQPDGARALLATVAGSMITVAGVTFSLTILAVSHATSTFGPRLLDNFMRDRGNQITLGTFVATFLYCLLILRVVRGTGSEEFSADAFVPHLSVMVALVLTIASVAQLVFFIHHVPESMHISTVLRRLARDMMHKMNELFPEAIGKPATEANQTERNLIDEESHHRVRAKSAGYFQGVDNVELVSFAKKNNTVVELTCRPGDFLRCGETVMKVRACESWQDGCEDELWRSIATGASRTPTQDIFFILNQFVEVAVRALSPGVNDPFTAMQCMDWLSTGLVELSRRQLPAPHRTDDDGNVRVITPDAHYKQFTDVMIGQLKPYAMDDQNARRYLQQSLRKVVEISECEHLNDILKQYIDELGTG